MSDDNTFGSKRLVVGAHYGLRDWLSQRVTAVLMTLYTLLLIVQLLFGPKLGYVRWSAIFSQQWMRFASFVVIVALAVHAWVGMRDIWMDYIKPTALRLALEVATFVALVAYAAWLAQILWATRQT
jgi:succinate dehydrogenase / fumarate reductase membrane anchor subunit